jgi:O-acetylhomoserine (thiol)-lyase
VVPLSQFFSTDHGNDYSDDYIRNVLGRTKTIAMVGASTRWNRPSYFAMKYLQGKGFRVIPVNPRAAGETLLGETVVSSLKEIDVPVDMVDVFRKPSDVPPIAQDAIDIGAKVLWMQLGVTNEEAKDLAEANGLSVVMNRCPKIEFSRLYGELGWQGFDSHIISSKKQPVGHQDGKQTVVDPTLPTFDHFETKQIHAGASPCPTTGARATPIYQTTAYVFESVDQAAQLFNLQAPGNIYTRLTNPTTSVLEQRIASLEGGRGATCTSSGHAAQLLALFPLLSPGDKLISSDKLYGGSLTQFGKTFQKFAWGCDFVDVDDLESVRQALQQDNVKALFCESIANPGGAISDLEALAKLTEVSTGLCCLLVHNFLVLHLFNTCRRMEFRWSSTIPWRLPFTVIQSITVLLSWFIVPQNLYQDTGTQWEGVWSIPASLIGHKMTSFHHWLNQRKPITD